MKALQIFLITILFFSCKNTDTLFEKTDPQKTGITFINQIQESEKENILTYEYFYNGGGVAAGDFNNDGLTDLYFSGNQVENKLYLNKGNWQFEDISLKSGTAGRNGGWKTGVSLVDINADGWLDIYLCYSGLKEENLRKNQLFINNHDLTFTEKAAEYGLDDPGYSTQAAFLDYDLDGDLDCFLINHNLKNYERKEANIMRSERDKFAGDKLFQNNQGKFTDVSENAGIKGNPLGFGLGLMVSDINADGYPDIYVTNDYVEDDYLYINQKNGTFKDELRNYIQHTSYSSMGIDIADLNNDQLPDIFTLDMLPHDNARQKTLLWPDNWNVYQSQLQNGFWHQNMRNMLQINQGNGSFAEIGQLAGVSNTDWSWGTLLADYDLDGFKDIFVSNGLGKDFTNADFIKYYDQVASNGKNLSLPDYLKQMPSSETKNYIFQNNKNLGFENRQKEWGFDEAAISSGCTYADLDNDGDLDIITNNLNETARIFRNNAADQKTAHNFLKIQLRGKPGNTFGIGAKVFVKNKEAQQYQENNPTHGFQSSVIQPLIFGLGTFSGENEVTVIWPNGKSQRVPVNSGQKTLILEEKNASTTTTAPLKQEGLFEEINYLSYQHKILPVNDFDHQIMLPCHYSYHGPKMAVGDINGDDNEDVFICGSSARKASFLIKTADKFIVKTADFLEAKENQDAVLADFNGDKFPDLYLANGNYRNAQVNENTDELWFNDGKGNFSKGNLPPDALNNSCVKVLDIDNDGDLDLFVGGSIQANKYPFCEESRLLKNDGKGNFSPASLGKIGLVNDAVVTDFDKDGFPDLLVVGEWFPPLLLKNNKGTLSSENQPESLKNLSGWYNAIDKADLDGDGDEDFVLGNLGINTQIKASATEPASLIYNDFDQNGTIDFFMNYYIQGKSYPAASRDEIAEQIPALKKIFPDYQSYASATIEQFFESQQLSQAQKREITQLNSVILENAKGDFVVHQLPVQAQYAPVYALALDDFNADGKKDILLMGNNSRFRLRIGKVDANFGIILLNKGNFMFDYLPQNQSGLDIRGDVRSVRKIGNDLLIGVNDNTMKYYRLRKNK